MTQTDFIEIGRNIIRENSYLTLATADGKPWAAPVFYAVDAKWTFYFISQLDSLHIRHIFKNPLVAFAIFDSHQKEGSGNGVQGLGTARLLNDDELDEAFRWYNTSFVEMKDDVTSILNKPYLLSPVSNQKQSDRNTIR